MKTEAPTGQDTNATYATFYREAAPARRFQRSGVAPGTSGVAPESLPVEALDAVVFGRLVALEAQAPGFLVELIAEFESGINRRLAELRTAVRTNDAEAIAYAAHSIRGSCGTVGAMRMSALAHHLEYGQPSPPEIVAIVRRLGAEWRDVREALGEVRAA
jgi:HPt (histidine-containing phosphotransfer) domain-containing protein